MRTTKTLIKKCIRDIIRNVKQFIAIIFIICVAVTLFVGLLANSNEFERRVNIVYEKGNIADIWVTVNPDLFSSTEMEEEYNTLVEINGGDADNVEKRLYLPTTINNLSANALISKDFPKINTAYDLNLGNNPDPEWVNKFFVIDEDFLSRYEIMTGKTINLGDNLTINVDLASLGLSADNFTNSAEVIYSNLVNYVEDLNLFSEAVKSLILTYLNDNKDTIINEINNVLSQVLSLESLDLDVQVNGFMKHPENIQSATFNDSSYLLCSKTVLINLIELVVSQINIENETISTIVQSYMASLENSINDGSNEYIEMLLNNLNNQFIIKLGENKKLDTVKNEINRYYSSKDNLLALFDINTMPSNAVIQNDIIQSRQLTYAFPILFFAVAILVVLTTISQLILKERTQIGTLKSLGLSKLKILFYYTIMMSIITSIGTILGFIIGPILLPQVMNLKYSILYSLPEIQYLFPFLESFIVLIAIILAVSLLTFLLIKTELDLTPANSMRPATPKIKFKEKKNTIKNISLMMALRNIKVHFTKSMMVVLGILGCTGLLICGMGIDDTINYGIDVDLNNILASDLQVTYNSGAAKGVASQKLLELTNEDGELVIDEAEEFSIMQVTVSFNENNLNASLYYFDKNATNFKYEKWDDLNGEGIAINESKAQELGVDIGDIITFSVNGTEYTKQIVDIFYTFIVSGLFVYTETIPELTNTRTNCWITVKEGHTEDEVKEIILNSGIKEINGALTKVENLARVDGYMANVSTMTYTIKIFAIVLAVIVLINLSILNFRERLRDYATLKVLGYSRFEIARSMIYEVMLLTTIGSLLGMGIGLPLEMLVLSTNKTPLLNWKYVIFPNTYLIAFLISFLVALAVNCLMTYEIKKISMSESLKSVE